MLLDRVRPADTQGMIYHYCSSDTLIAILTNGTIRYSDINMLNDAEEGRWGYSIFEEAANRLLQRKGIPDVFPEITREFIDEIDKRWSASGLHFASFVACFSSDGDSLSQWRAYADDGRGFAIGFDAREIRRSPIQMLDVLYDKDQQISEMIIAIAAIHAQFMEENKKFEDSWFLETCVGLAGSALALKNPAWRDEKEVRCHHLVDIEVFGETWKMTDNGGFVDGEEVSGQPIGFQVRAGTIVPYLDMPFLKGDGRQAVKEIVCGPKCPNAFGNIMFLMGNLGYSPVKLKLAGGAYR